MPSTGEASRDFGETGVFGFELEQIARPADDQAKNIRLDRLFIKIVRAQFDGAQRIFPICLAGGDDDLCRRRQFANGGERREALGRFVGMRRQTEIDDRHRDRLPANDRNGLLPRPGEMQPHLGENPFVLTPKPLVVLHDQQLSELGEGSFMPQIVPVPFPRALETCSA